MSSLNADFALCSGEMEGVGVEREACRSNAYARFLAEKGCQVVQAGGMDWYRYNGFMMPAYLPYHCPPVTEEAARQAQRMSGAPFVRWDSDFGRAGETSWWYILKRGSWSVESVKDKKKRWMVRQGIKNFTVRPMSYEEVVEKCPAVAAAAVSRYKNAAKPETRETFEQRTEAGRKAPGVLEYIGCFSGETLVSYSENYIQGNAVWLETIRHDPAHLNNYSSYGLMNGILDHYLNERKMEYVLDGSRAIHHRTDFQDHLIRIFGFEKEYARLHVEYAWHFGAAVKMLYPLKSMFRKAAEKWVNPILEKVCGILLQEEIRMSCLPAKPALDAGLADEDLALADIPA